MPAIEEKYRIEISSELFSVNGNTLSQQTVCAFFFDANGQVSRKRKFGLVAKETVYEKIKNGENIILDNCYIKDFSLIEYHRLNNIGDREYIELKNFSAQNAFFDCEKATDFSFAKFNSKFLNFNRARFGDGSLNFYKAQFSDSTVDFSETEFGAGNVNFQFTEFGNGDITFEGADFGSGNISFVNSNFGDGKISFKGVDFGDGDVTFHYAKFNKGEITFDKARFGGGDVDFRKVEFPDGKVEFRRVHFGDGDVSFEESEFKSGKVSFRSAVFGTGNVSFEMADFGSDEVFFERVNFGSGNVSFLNVIFNNLSFKESHLNNYLDLRVNKGNKVDLSDTIVRDIIDFKPVKSPVDIEELNITGMRNLGAIFIGWNENGVYNLIANQPDTSLREKANQFNILKEDYNSTGQYGDEDRAYVAFKRFELKADLEESVKESPLNVFWIYPLSFVKWLVADKIGLYATNPLRVLISMSVVYVLFSLLYTIMPEFMHSDVICSGADNDKFPYWALAFYFSAITFLTIGYGDCLPEGHIKWIAPIEGWMGMFLLAYFTVAFMRKILR